MVRPNKPMENKDSGGGHGIRRILRAIVALIVSAATLLTGASTALATQAAGLPGYWYNPASDGSGWFTAWHGTSLGVVTYNGDTPIYCIEAGIVYSGQGTWEPATDRDSKIAAFMVEQHKNDRSDMTQAAVAYAIHAHLDRGQSHFNQLNAVGLEGADINAVAQLANQLWNDASLNMPDNIQASYQYTQGKRKGTFDPGIKNANGQYIAGVSYTVTVTNGLAVFDSTGTTTYSGVTSGNAEHIGWTATGNGQAQFSITYKALSGVKMNSPDQDLFRVGDPSNVSGNIQFDVVKDFQPTVSTQVSNKKLNAGETIKDNVTSGVAQGDSWVDDTTVKAKGYYFTGDGDTILRTIDQNGTVENPENPNDYLKRVEDELGEPVATAETEFNGSGQTNEVTAKAADGTDYVNPQDGLFGGWLWLIVKDDQSDDDKQYIKNNYIDEFGKVSETAVHTATVSEWSEVAEPSATENADVRDVIHLNNLPEDLGEFKGNDEYGFGADNTKLDVEVWWAGSGTGVKEEDEKYLPSTKEPPAQDEHHKLLGTYTYDLQQLIQREGKGFNGRLDILVGGDAGSPLADGSNFTITADETGYYVFIAKYAGCDRVKAFTSDYDNRFEATFVSKDTPMLTLSSSTKPGTVKVGEEMRDTATISGTGNSDGAVSEGAYVLFDAYNPVPGEADPSVGKLLDSDRHELTAEQIDDLNNGKQITVTSNPVKATTSGNVYWQAAIYAADGTLLATHELGIEDETTVVKGGGDISSVSQKQGAVGGQMWDIITVSDDTDGDDAGNIPDGSTVQVSVYKHEGQNQETKGQLVETKTFPVDTSKLGERPGSYSFQALMDGTYPAAGTYYWVERLIGPDGGVIAEGKYGDDTERTYVQEYDTDAAKAWLSTNDAEYADKTVNTFDVLTQKYYTQWGEDDQTGSSTSVYFGATAKGTQAQFSIWREGDGNADTDVKVLDGQTMDLPKIGDRKEPYSQKLKSETFTLPEDTVAGTHYYMLRVTNMQDAANLQAIGIQSDGLVWESPKRVERESFEVVRVTSTAAEPIVTTDMPHVQETLHVDGTLGKGSAYQVETWTVGDDGNTDEKVGETDRVTLDHDVTDTDIAVTLDTPADPGTYQFRFKVWSPDNLGGDPDVTADAGTMMPDDWKQGDDYAQKVLLYEGTNVESERFNVIRISTDVTGTANMHTAKGEHYVDVTNGADINDHAMIEGDLDRDGYRLGFELYKQADGDDASKDTLTLTIPATDLKAATKELDSDLAQLDQPGDYYWVTVFSKADGSAFLPDGQTEVRSDRRIKEESFHAVRITTTTYKWSSAGGAIHDVAHIEGTLPGDAIIGFELHDYETGDKVADAEDSTLSDMDGYVEDAKEQTVTSPAVTVPDAGDHYFVEWVRIPGDDQGEDKEFHRGNDRVDNESTRTISVTTETYTEAHLGDTVSDQTFFDNISYETDIRSDYVDKELSASWEVWKQGDGDTDTDTLLTTLDKDGQTLEEGQTTTESSKWTPAQTGIYYFRVRVTAQDGTLVAYGAPREPSETIRIIDSLSNTIRVVEEGKPVKDKVTISGPVLEGTMVSWQVFRQADTPDEDELVADWGTPTTGAYIITKDDAAKALKDGKVTIESPLSYDEGKAGDVIYFQYSLTAPKRGEDGNPAQPAKDDEGNWTMDHLMVNGIQPIDTDAEVDGDDTDPQTVPSAFHTDLARVEEETAYIVKVTTTASTHEATVGDKIHDTAHVTGTIPGDGWCIEFEYWEQADGDDTSEDKLVTTTECVAVTPGENPDVDSPEITADKAGTHYWRERLIYHKGEEDEHEVSYGKARVKDETVIVKAKPLATTGIAVGGVAGLSALLALGGCALAVSKRRRPRGQHAA